MHRLQCLSLALKPFSRHSCLLHHHQQLMERVIGTSVMPMILLNLLSIAALLHCFFFLFTFLLLSTPNSLDKYSFHTHVFWCRVDRCLDVDCGLVALITFLLLRRLLSSSVPFFEITIPQSYQYSVLSQHFATIFIYTVNK